jgi:hypothetical protein
MNLIRERRGFCLRNAPLEFRSRVHLGNPAMMIIREEQFQALATAQLESFIRRMTEMLQASFPEWCTKLPRDTGTLEEVVRAAVDEANHYDIEAESDLEFYIQCLPAFGLKFVNDPAFRWAGEIIKSPDLTGTEKMDLIHDHLVFTQS